MLLDQNGNEIFSGAATSVAVLKEKLIPHAPHSPEQLKAWQDELDKITDPTSTVLTSLRLVWMPGDWWDPVNRYVIYQMFAPGIFPFGVNEEELKGPDPRTYAGDYDLNLQRYVRKQEITIDRQQWRLYQETGQYGIPFWIVQGPNGGHLRRFTATQAALSKLEGGWEYPPAPGDLPFASPNNLTFDALRELDQLQAYEGLVAFHLRAPQMIQGEQADQAKRMREKMWRQLKSQQEGLWDDEGWAIKAIREQIPHGVGRSKSPDYEQIERNFIEDD